MKDSGEEVGRKRLSAEYFPLQAEDSEALLVAPGSLILSVLTWKICEPNGE